MRVRPSPSQPFLTELHYINVIRDSLPKGMVFFYLHEPNRGLTDLFFATNKEFGKILHDLQSE